MSNEISIKPKEFGKKATKVEIEVGGFPLNSKTGNATAIFKDEEGNGVGRERLEIPEEVFAKWGTDDSIIEDYVLKTLGLKKS